MRRAQYRVIRTLREADLRCLHCYHVKTLVCAMRVYEGEKYAATCSTCGHWRHRAVTGMRHRAQPLWEAAAQQERPE